VLFSVLVFGFWQPYTYSMQRPPREHHAAAQSLPSHASVTLQQVTAHSGCGGTPLLAPNLIPRRCRFRLYLKTVFLATLRRGVGKSTVAEKWTYEGEWVNDAMDGKGVFAYASGATYDGQWAGSPQIVRGCGEC